MKELPRVTFPFRGALPGPIHHVHLMIAHIIARSPARSDPRTKPARYLWLSLAALI